MLNEAYVKGQQDALATTAKIAGLDMTKLANFFQEGLAKAKAKLGAGKDAVVGYHKRGAGEIGAAFAPKHTKGLMGEPVLRTDKENSIGERAKHALKGAAHFLPHAGAVGGGAALAMSDD